MLGAQTWGLQVPWSQYLPGPQGTEADQPWPSASQVRVAMSPSQMVALGVQVLEMHWPPAQAWLWAAQEVPLHWPLWQVGAVVQGASQATPSLRGRSLHTPSRGSQVLAWQKLSWAVLQFTTEPGCTSQKAGEALVLQYR